MSQDKSNSQTSIKVLKADSPLDGTATDEAKKTHPETELPPNNNIRVQYTDDPLHLKNGSTRFQGTSDNDQQ